ncbi:MAG TPA: DUF1361 domain-containing protein [Patescibacteria group bacterium]|nr:DUF1361 domain-containing protein [Patescibacteria group bacterium]
MKWFISTRARLGLALGAATLTSVSLFFVAAAMNHNYYYSYMIWNIVLAWMPFGLMILLEKTLRRKLWSSWEALALTALFVGFLPNTFYVLTDIIHIYEEPRADIVFDVIMLGSFVFNAFILGLISVFMFHVELRRRLTSFKSWSLIAILIFATSFAIYVGRDLRWNTWDILFNPASVLFEVSDRILSPLAHPEVYSATLGFFVLITSVYVTAWYIARAARQLKMPD